MRRGTKHTPHNSILELLASVIGLWTDIAKILQTEQKRTRQTFFRRWVDLLILPAMLGKRRGLGV